MSAGISGIVVSDDVMNAFDEIKKKKLYRYVTFVIGDDKKSVIVGKKGARDTTYEAFAKEILAQSPPSPCYIVFDFEYQRDGGISTSKLLFIAWIPDNASVKPKMMYASTKDSVKAKIEGGLVEIQATDASELDPAFVRSKVGN